MKITITVLLLAAFTIVLCTGCTSPSDADNTSEASTSIAAQAATTAAPESIDPAEAIASGTKTALESKGWSDIRVVKGELDSRQWGGLILEPDDRETYTVLGQTEGMHDTPITAVIKLDAATGERYDVFYVSSAGRVLGSEVEKDIFAADDQELWNYMYAS